MGEEWEKKVHEEGGEEGSGRSEGGGGKVVFSRRNRIVNGLGFYTFCGFEVVSF